MSGDHGEKDYDEVNSMKQYCVDKGIEANVIFLDHAGFPPTTPCTVRAIFLASARSLL